MVTSSFLSSPSLHPFSALCFSLSDTLCIFVKRCLQHPVILADKIVAGLPGLCSVDENWLMVQNSKPRTGACALERALFQQISPRRASRCVGRRRGKSVCTTRRCGVATGPRVSSQRVEFSPVWGSFPGFVRIPSVILKRSISASIISSIHKKVVIAVHCGIWKRLCLTVCPFPFSCFLFNQ